MPVLLLCVVLWGNHNLAVCGCVWMIGAGCRQGLNSKGVGGETYWFLYTDDAVLCAEKKARLSFIRGTGSKAPFACKVDLCR